MTKEKALEVLKSHREKQMRSSRYIHNFMEITKALQVAIDMLEQDLKFKCDRWIMPCDKWCGDADCKVKQVGDAI